MEKRGLNAALQEANITGQSRSYHCDEMRFGLWGQVRRRWGLRGVKIIQPRQIEFAWRYLVLAVDVLHCHLKWAWAERMKQAHLIPIFEVCKPDAVIWDGASSHRGQAMGKLPFERIFLPPYSPELNPAERVFEEIRAEIEGEVYPSLIAKQYAIEQVLRRLNADKVRLDNLVGWNWIRQAYDQLPLEYTCLFHS